MIRGLAHTISYIFHPIFMVFYMLLVMIAVNPYSFGFGEVTNRNVMLISVGALTVLFPIIAIVLLKMLGLIDSIELRTQKERVAPLAMTSIFYLWLFVNIKSNSAIAPMFSSYVLGAIIGVFMALLLNAFTKVSLHAMGIAGMLTGFVLFRFFHAYEDFLVGFNETSYVIQTDVIVILLVVIVGLVGSSRLLLKSHTTEELIGGYFIGFVAQLLAYRFFIL